jgi:NAD(P)-dependent dehydrogenase (short-subunit alcohol dehydrogenase family)
MASTDIFNISDRVIVITGGSGALGGSMAKYLLDTGARVALLGMHQDRVDKRVSELGPSNANVIGFAGNVLNKKWLLEVCAAILQKWGQIDGLINAAGGNMPGATIGTDQTIFDLNMDDFRKVTELNLDGTVLPSLVFGEVMAKQGKGTIINLSSMTADRTITRVVGYSASKAAIDNFTKWMATEMALKFGSHIRVNAIAPGFFIGNQNRALLTEEDGSYTPRGKSIIAHTPMKRFGKAEELHGAVHWLLSDASSFVTGTIIPVDGGFSAYSGV